MDSPHEMKLRCGVYNIGHMEPTPPLTMFFFLWMGIFSSNLTIIQTFMVSCGKLLFPMDLWTLTHHHSLINRFIILCQFFLMHPIKFSPKLLLFWIIELVGVNPWCYLHYFVSNLIETLIFELWPFWLLWYDGNVDKCLNWQPIPFDDRISIYEIWMDFMYVWITAPL